MMNTSQINTLMRSDPVTKQFYGGAFPCDKIPKPLKPSCYIVNTDTSKNSGEHWVALFVNTLNSSKSCYFDSYGRPPNTHIAKYLDEHCPHYQQSTCRIQGVLASTCAFYCIHFCMMVCRGRSLNSIVHSFDHDDNVTNDVVITHFINKIYDTSFPIYDTNFIKEQIARAETV